jgi:pimeloyl-ACP methyl ester carboxylesterase
MRKIQACVMSTLLTLVTATDGHGQEPAITPQTHTVSVNGHAMRAQSYGLATRTPGVPVVVFEAGATNPLEVWQLIAPEVARFAPVITYDRAGLGQSAWDDNVPTPEHVASRLSTLLEDLGAEPPYILVGYSWGGVLARYFAGLNPDAIAGIVYVDPGPIITQTRAEELRPFEESGAGEAGYDALMSGVRRLLQQAPEPMRAEFEVFTGLMQTAPSERRLLPIPDVPAVAIIAAKHQPMPDVLQLPYDQAAHFAADVRHRMHMLSEWVLPSPSGMVNVSRTTSHMVPAEDPELVTWAVRRVVSSVERQ